jgi:hypothetical protein
MASAILAALPLVLVFAFFQRQIIKGIATTGSVGSSSCLTAVPAGGSPVPIP